MLVLVHQLMGVSNFIEAERFRQTRVYRARGNQFVEGSGLFIVGQVTTLETFLHHPMIAKIQCHVVARSAGTNHNHAPDIAHETRRRQGRFAGVFENNLRVLALARIELSRRAR